MQDPYIKFELLEWDDVHFVTHVVASVCTSVHTADPKNPIWGPEDDATFNLAAASPNALALLNGIWPTIRISVLDKDYGDDDDLLGQVRAEPSDPTPPAHAHPVHRRLASRAVSAAHDAPPSLHVHTRCPQGEAQLEAKEGVIEQVALSGVGGFAGCAVSLEYEVFAHVPPPPAAVTIRDVHCGAIEATGAPLSRVTRPRGGRTGVHLRFVLLDDVFIGGRATRRPFESADECNAAARTPTAHVAGTTGSSLRWDDLAWRELSSAALQLMLPTGGPRPPVVRVELWDADLPARVRQPLAACDVKLGERPRSAFSSSRKVVLEPCSAPGGGLVKHVEVEFAFQLREL
jgi:hypothetical protein